MVVVVVLLLLSVGALWHGKKSGSDAKKREVPYSLADER